MIERNKSDHKFAHVMAAQLPWHVQNYGLIGSLFFMSEQDEFLQDVDYKLIRLKWNVPQLL